VQQSHIEFSQTTYHQGKKEGFHRENGQRGKLRLKLKARGKTWAMRGKGFWQSFLILFFIYLNESPRLHFISEKDGYSVWG
jgi:hypothetical protein